MDASQCSVLVVADPQNSDESLSLLHTTFSYVTFIPTHTDVVGILQAHNHNKGNGSSTLVILDDSVYSKEELFDTLESLRFALSIGVLRHVGPIVYSSSQSTDYMLECLDHGAVNYILKPLRQDVVTTLFLNTLRASIRQRRRDHKDSSFGIKDSVNSKTIQGKMWKSFEQRLQSLGEVNQNLIHQSISNFFKSDNTISRSDMNKISSSDMDTQLKTRLSTWGFSPFDLRNYELLQCTFLVLRHVLDLPGLKDHPISDDELYDFLYDVANMYQPLNPYHNFQHAVDVMQSIFYFLCRTGVLPPIDPQASPSFATEKQFGHYDWLENGATMKDLFAPIDILALILASIGHDVGHPGVNNMFMIRTATPLSLMYNDRSVLESFHAMVFFNILQRHCFRPLTEWQTTAKYTRFRKIVVQSILATDMGLHDDYVNKIQRQRERLKTHPVDITNKDQAEDEIILICSSLIKCADISNCARPFPVAKEWSEILQREFFAQGDLERELGLSVLPMNDRGKVSLEDFQLGFIKNVSGKLFEAVANVLPDMKFTVDTIESNCVTWEARKQEQAGLDTNDGESACDTTHDQSENVPDQSQAPKKLNENEIHGDNSTGTIDQQQKSSPIGRCDNNNSNSSNNKDDIQAQKQNQQLANNPGDRRKKKKKLLRHCILQ